MRENTYIVGAVSGQDTPVLLPHLNGPLVREAYVFQTAQDVSLHVIPVIQIRELADQLLSRREAVRQRLLDLGYDILDINNPDMFEGSHLATATWEVLPQ